MKKTLLLISLNLCLATFVFSQQYDFRKPQNYRNWKRVALGLGDDFYKSEEAKRIADNVLLYQLTTGAWPKNIFMAKELTESEKVEIISKKGDVDEGTIDNGATTTEIQFLAKVYREHKDDRYKQAVIDGIDFLLKAQYDNGGWPQCYPRTKGYVTQIQYNDNSNVNVLNFVRDIYQNKDLYSFVSEDRLEKLKKAFDKGIDCILKTQVKQNGKLTVWCAQYDHETLLPAKARAYEHISLSGQESDNIVLLLMSLENPSQEIIDAVDAAIEWFEKVKIEGIKIENFVNEEGQRDRRIVKCNDCPPTWARFYDIEDNRPFISDRDGIKRYELSDYSKISHERRNGYSWYNNDGEKLLRKYKEWKAKLGKS